MSPQEAARMVGHELGGQSMSGLAALHHKLQMIVDGRAFALSTQEARRGVATLDAAIECCVVLSEVLAVLRKHAPGTILNGDDFKQLGIRANNAVDAARAATGEPLV